MKRLTSQKTLMILDAILQAPSFTQSKISEKSNVSIGRVNTITKWLIQKGIAKRETGRYLLIAPNKLIRHIADQHVLEEDRTIEINCTKKEAKKILKKEAILCLHSALEEIQEIEITEELHAYANPNIITTLNRLDPGQTKIILHKEPKTIMTKESITSPIQTMIDLHAVEENKLTKELSLRLWDTLQ
ncbi:MAG: winged helix-turn-helix transcriptional regulator [Candidatus Woesearchaeota archaeon]